MNETINGSLATLTQNCGTRIAYRKVDASASLAASPVIIFLGGFASDMEGSKASALDEFARVRGYGFIRFDYRGHGASGGEFTKHGIMDWTEDARLVLEHCAPGRVLLIGSSMGGWIAHLLAREMPRRIAGMIGIAAAPDFTEGEFWAGFSKAEREKIEAGGIVEAPSGYDEPYKIAKALIEQGRAASIFAKPFRADFPIRYFYGARDEAVSFDTTRALLEHVEGDDVRLVIEKSGDHGFSRPGDLALIFAAIDEIMKIAQ